MKFWAGLLISLFGGLIGIGLFRESLKPLVPNLDDIHLDIASIIILLIGLIMTAFDHADQSKSMKQLEDEQKGRIIKQKLNLLKALNNLPKTKVILYGIQGDREAVKFANTIKNILVDVNWDVDGVWEDIIVGGIGFGVTIRETSTDTNSIGKIMNKIMNENHIATRVVVLTNSDLEQNQIEIIVGSRP